MDPNQNNINPPNPKLDNTPAEPNGPVIIRPDTTQPVQDTPTPPAESAATPDATPETAPAPVTTDEAQPASPAAQPAAVTPQESSAQPGAVVGGTEPIFAMESKKKSKKPAIFAATAVALLAIAGAGFYFGYYTNSKLAYSQGLNNSGKVIGELTNSLVEKPAVAYKGYVGSGSYKVESDSFSTDGKLAFKADDKKNTETSFDVGVGVSRVDVTVKSFASAGTNPDLYVKAGGIKGLGDLAGPEVGVLTTKYEDKWIVIDHTLLDNAQKQLTSTESGKPPTREQILSQVDVFSDVNQQYVFSTDEEKAVLEIRNDYGMKTVDGRKVFHYEVGIDKANLKKYIDAQESALKTSKLNAWIKDNNYEKEVETYFDDAIKSVDDIKSSDTFDMYVDANKRFIYKLRFDKEKNPAANFVDVGLDYKGGDELPFFVAGKSKDKSGASTFNVRITGNTETKAVTFKLVAEDDSSDKMKVTSDFTFKPSTTAVTITKPEGAVQLATLFEELGVADPFGAAASVGETLGVSTSKKN